MKKMLMGNEAMGYGAVEAGIDVACGYPGTPSTEVLETAAKLNDGSFYVEWSVNEKVAMELAAGASYSGARVLVTMKQVGLNVAADPLMCLSYIGVKGGVVVLVADDPGPNSSQTEQDTRHFAEFANLPVLDPSTPEEAYLMMKYAFTLSEKVKLPVILRPTTRVCHACCDIEITGDIPKHRKTNFVKNPDFVIFPPLALKKHIELENTQEKLKEIFAKSDLNKISGEGEIGIVTSGISYAYVHDVLASTNIKAKVLKIGTPYPFPEKFAEKYLQGVKKVICIEELDGVLEKAIKEVCYKFNLKTQVFGKESGNVSKCGEFSFEKVKVIIEKFFGIESETQKVTYPEKLPMRAPALCAGCPHRASFYAVKCAMKGKDAVFTGDIGCYTLGNAKPLETTDTCLCMGASITSAQGIKRTNPEKTVFAFIGDSTFFHSGITGVVNALYNATPIVVVVLDNRTTAMTGHQPHPGIGKTMMGTESKKIDIYNLLKGLGVEFVERVNPFDQEKAVEAAREAAKQEKVSAIIFESPCIALFKSDKKFKVDAEKCKSCKRCIEEIGCPAIFLSPSKKAEIDASLCNGCGLCENLCKFGAIGDCFEKGARDEH